MKKVFIVIGVVILALLSVFGYLFCFTEVLGKKLLPVSINEVSVSYIPGKDLNFEGSYLSVLDFKVKDDELFNLKALLRGVKQTDSKSKDIIGKYKIIINKNCELVFNEKEAYVLREKKKTMVKVSSNLYNFTEELVNKNNDKVYTSIGFKDVIIKKNKASIGIKNEYNLELLKNHMKYYKFEAKSDELKDIGDVNTEIILDNNIHIYIYNGNVIQIKDVAKKESFYAISDEQLFNICDSIYNSSTQQKEEKK